MEKEPDAAPKARRRHGGCTNTLIAILIVTSTIVGIFGCVAFGIGVFLTEYRLSFVSIVIGTSLIYNATIMMTIGAGLCIILSFIGCCGLVAHSKRLLILFTVFLVAVFALEWTAASTSIVFRSWMQDQMRTYMRNALQVEYGTNTTTGNETTECWDIAQQQWYCCSVEDESWGVYRQSEWYTMQPGVPEADKPLVPKSCCRMDQYGNYIHLQKCQTFMAAPPGRQSGEYNEALFYRGCYEAGKDILYTIAGYVIGISISLYVIMTFAIVATLCVCRMLETESAA